MRRDRSSAQVNSVLDAVSLDVLRTNMGYSRSFSEHLGGWSIPYINTLQLSNLDPLLKKPQTQRDDVEGCWSSLSNKEHDLGSTIHSKAPASIYGEAGLPSWTVGNTRTIQIIITKITAFK